jgi:progesterone-induced-blocking factor 1
VQVKVYETLQTYIRELEQYQGENHESNQILIQFKAQIEREKAEKESVARQLKDMRDDARRKIDSLERRNNELEADNTAMHS